MRKAKNPEDREDAASARTSLHAAADTDKAAFLARYFKTGPGQYAAGDVFIGVTVPTVRKIARAFHDLPLTESVRLLQSRVHEERLLALLVLVARFERGDESEREKIFALYTKHLHWVNNWDLVDLSAPKIVGERLATRPRELLVTLARSKSLWDRRIAIVSTFAFIRRNDFETTFSLAERLLDDKEDLIHKATGWMLREVGKRDERELRRFLDRSVSRLPRTTLRYAIERFPPEIQSYYLKLPRQR